MATRPDVTPSQLAVSRRPGEIPLARQRPPSPWDGHDPEPSDWPVLVDARVQAAPWVVVGSGVRRSKLVIPGSFIARAGGEVHEDLAIPAPAQLS